MSTPTLPQVLVTDALRDLENTLTRFRSMYPPPYLDRSTAGLAYRALVDCRNELRDLTDGEVTQ